MENENGLEKQVGKLTRSIGRFRTIFTIVSLALAIMGTVSMAMFIFEETLQSMGMAAYIYKSGDLPQGALEAADRLEAMTNRAAWFINHFGWLAPLNWGSFKAYVEAARFQVEAYRKWAGSRSPELARKVDEAKVAKVLDGDSLVLETGEEIRLAGIDAPEWYEPRGQEAKAFLTKLVLLKSVKIDRIDIGYYGRTIANISIDGQDAGALLVKAGLATPLTPAKVKQAQADEGIVVRVEEVYHASGNIVVNASPVNVFVPKGSVEQVSKNIDFDSLAGKLVEVFGEIKMYRGEPEVVVNTPDQLVVKSVATASAH